MEMEEESRTKAVKAQLLCIPQDLVVDVLTNLPVKSLLRFRCVCKLWCSLILDPHFIKSQANVNNNNNHPKHVIIKSVIGFESLHIIDYKTSVRKFEFRDTSFYIKDFDQILGPCNGLLVIADFYKMKAVLWNPLTKEYKRVLNYPHEVSYYHSLSGLGFDSSTDEYKLIMANTTYSFGTDSWTAVQVFPYSWVNQLATLVNGTPHWIVDRKHGSPVISLITYFDFKEEKFKEVVLPHGSSTYGELVLGVMRGCLCVTRKNDESHEIWLMKDYGTVKEPWTKLFVIPQYCDYLKPLCFTEDGKVLLEIRSTEQEEFWRTVIYDPNKSSYESTYENISSEIFMTFTLVAYRESLISPKAHVHGTKQKCW